MFSMNESRLKAADLCRSRSTACC